MNTACLTRDEILAWLRQDDPAKLDDLWRRADAARRSAVGNAVHLRGLIEVSNHCIRRCGYCGLRAGHSELERYRLTSDEVIGCARHAVKLGYGTVVLQAGEDPVLTQDWVVNVITRIKRETALAVTLSLGERSWHELLAWKKAGADRYLLRFETSDPELYRKIHPPHGRRKCDRARFLPALREIGYEIGSGVMIGIPGQTYSTLVNDILRFSEMDLDMIGVGPWLAHPATPLGRGDWDPAVSVAEQVPASELMVYKVVALARLVCPHANIPSTTALATLNRKNGRELGLQRGANVFMPNLTPLKYRSLYEIYPAKACIYETADSCHACLQHRIAKMGRHVGSGPGGRRRCGAVA
ncbi:MAG TPA: [FeFe] hydrogenase H-cluster radical SAM maturase HydE [Tepidisphaeraceae bacterium]|nr:[FeFe] hydrogenase H-cluster radical SAM maturase HydE [Tepidisphaeraceae bacterium]